MLSRVPFEVPATRVTTVGHGRAAHRAEPLVADAELLGEVRVHRELRGGVVGHDDPRVAHERTAAGLHVVADEAGALVLQLLVDAPARVAWILRLHELGARGGMDAVRLAPVLVLHLEGWTLDVVAMLLDRQEAEHVIERAVLQHQDDDVVDLLKVLVRCCHPPSSIRRCALRWKCSKIGGLSSIVLFHSSTSFSTSSCRRSVAMSLAQATSHTTRARFSTAR